MQSNDDLPHIEPQPDLSQYFEESNEPQALEKTQIRKSVLMFLVTFCSVFLVYGFQWTSGNPLTEPEIAWESIQFAAGLMGILLCHEMGHYVVAKKHGFALSVPYFLPFPFAFGTLGAVIQLKSFPKDRNGLLEMGAAGPIAGFIATFLCLVMDLGNTKNAPQLSIDIPKAEVEAVLVEASIQELETIDIWLQNIGLLSEVSVDHFTVMIMSDPLLFRAMHHLMFDEPLSKFAQLGPFAFAAWVGCMITSINLLPIGQLDGGHVVNALLPKHAHLISKTMLVCAILMGIFTWKGWLVWAILLYFMGATQSIPVPKQTILSTRAKTIALITMIVFLLCVMKEPIYSLSVPLDEINWVENSGEMESMKKDLLEME